MRTVPDWSIQAAWWGSGIFATGAVWYFLSTHEYPLAAAAGVAAVVLAGVAIALHRKKDAAQTREIPVPRDASQIESASFGDGKDVAAISFVEYHETLDALRDRFHARDEFVASLNGKLVRWEGVVSSVGRESSGMYLSIDTPTGVGSGAQVVCSLDQESKLYSLRRGDRVTVEGIFDGGVYPHPTIRDARVVGPLLGAA